jgi:hypothetical protein
MIILVPSAMFKILSFWQMMADEDEGGATQI